MDFVTIQQINCKMVKGIPNSLQITLKEENDTLLFFIL